jgi:hypothetical protein
MFRNNRFLSFSECLGGYTGLPTRNDPERKGLLELLAQRIAQNFR